MTVLKRADDKSPQLDALQTLLSRPDVDDQTRKRIQHEIWTTRAEIQGEREAAYEIDFQFANRESYAVIHDLRLEFNGRVAQIDHLLINRVLDVWVCETKAFSQGVKIDEFGEWYRYGGKFARGMASPVEQNLRHVEVLRDVLAKGAVQGPRRLGISIKPTFHPVVLISNGARIDRPRSQRARTKVEGLETVIKVEQLLRTVEKSFDERSNLSFVAKVVSAQTVHNLAEQLVALHQPQTFDWVARFGLESTPPAVAEPSTRSTQQGPATCASCGKRVSDRNVEYSRANAAEFDGQTLCFDCQRLVRQAKKRRAS